MPKQGRGTCCPANPSAIHLYYEKGIAVVWPYQHNYISVRRFGTLIRTATAPTQFFHRVLAMASKHALSDWQWRDSEDDSGLAGHTRIPTK